MRRFCRPSPERLPAGFDLRNSNLHVCYRYPQRRSGAHRRMARAPRRCGAASVIQRFSGAGCRTAGRRLAARGADRIAGRRERLWRVLVVAPRIRSRPHGSTLADIDCAASCSARAGVDRQRRRRRTSCGDCARITARFAVGGGAKLICRRRRCRPVLGRRDRRGADASSAGCRERRQGALLSVPPAARLRGELGGTATPCPVVWKSRHARRGRHQTTRTTARADPFSRRGAPLGMARQTGGP